MIINKNIIWLFIFFHLVGHANDFTEPLVDSTFIYDEQIISQLAKELIEVRFDDAKVLLLSKKLNETFEEVLKKENSFSYPFDSIPYIGKVVSEDGLVRIFTWYAVLADGSYTYFGFIQYFSKSKKSVLLYPLIDKSDEVEDERHASLSNQNWYGSTYYDIVQSKSKYGTLYILLGWDGNTLYSNKKVIESLIFSESGRPKFGKPVFVTGKIKVKRIVFEYSRMASMMLKYDKENKMIVMDHLSPSSPIYQGNTQFYGPDLSYDALKYEDGYWVYYPIIDYKPIETKKRFKKRNSRN